MLVMSLPERFHKRAHLGPSSSHQGYIPEQRHYQWLEVHLLLCLIGDRSKSHVIDQLYSSHFYSKAKPISSYYHF